ncbi:hypothetical protein HKCCE3408_07195 [Rhodobacterales bacterium HKCCE3408]|nr:hypothetical protein [Rhodobacterales bacterium HKCCE3408]
MRPAPGLPAGARFRSAPSPDRFCSCRRARRGGRLSRHWIGRFFEMDSRFAAALAASIALAGPAAADWGDNLISQGQGSPGLEGAVDCPPGGPFGPVWGTGTYTSDSSICTAAVHFGWITASGGGRVSYRTVPGMDSYQGSAQNGVTSSDYGTWSLSFQITGAAPLGPVPTGAQSIGWTDTADGLGIGASVGDSFSLACPPYDGTTAAIWGTDVYTSDSAVCVAAAHRGIIDAGSGGVVTITILAAQPLFVGSSRNGVSSSDYAEWDRSFVFR